MDPSIKLCVQFNGTAGDASASALIPSDFSDTPYGVVSIDTTDKKFGSGSLKSIIQSFPENGGAYAGVEWDFTEFPLFEFTEHAWIKFPLLAGVNVTALGSVYFNNQAAVEYTRDGQNYITGLLYARGYGAELSFGMFDESFSLPMSDNASGSVQNFLYDMDIWHHVAFTVADDVGYAFFDGVLVHSGAVTTGEYNNLRNVTVQLDLDSAWSDMWVNGAYVRFYVDDSAFFNVDELIVSATPLWTENFTVPSSELLGSEAQVGVTKLLLHMNQ